MKFELLPTIDIMFELYEKPRTVERFQEYLKTLQGDTKGDLAMPISGFNPMAKEHLLNKLTELRELKAEQVISETLAELNSKITSQSTDIFKVALNLSDDLKGGWTNRYTSDYDSKFKINALVNRKFCTPIFWTSESFTTELIKERTLEYVWRTVYWLQKPKPKTLRDHVEQEKFVVQRIDYKTPLQVVDLAAITLFYNNHQESDNYHIIFNFFFGDAASKSLEFATYGIKEEMAGFGYVRLEKNH
jgi:hypothetical protein